MNFTLIFFPLQYLLKSEGTVVYYINDKAKLAVKKYHTPPPPCYRKNKLV